MSRAAWPKIIRFFHIRLSFSWHQISKHADVCIDLPFLQPLVKILQVKRNMLICPDDKALEPTVAVKRMPPLTVQICFRHGANAFNCFIANQSEFCDELDDRFAVILLCGTVL
jgi:hypothetical protein